MPYALLQQSIAIPHTGKCVHLHMPDEAWLPQAYAQQKQENALAPFPYWARVWPSALALASWLCRHEELVNNKRVAELGAGIGLPSFVAAPLAASVLCSDWNEEAVALCQQNIEAAGYTHMQCRILNWHQMPADVHADLWLMSDVNYDPDDFPALLQLFEGLMQNGASILLATPQRLMAKSFIDALAPYIRSHDVMEAEKEGQSHAISILMLAK